MKVFLDTSVLSDETLEELATSLAEQLRAGHTLAVSVLTHFQILWGYSIAGLPSRRYEALLEKLGVDVAPLVEEDAKLAAQNKPGKKHIIDALIAASVTRYGGLLWTRDPDFERFLPRHTLRLL